MKLKPMKIQWNFSWEIHRFFHTIFKRIYWPNFMMFLWRKYQSLRHENLVENALKSHLYSTVQDSWKNLLSTKYPWKYHEIKWHVGINGIFRRSLNSCPMKNPWFSCERSNINESWKIWWILMAFSYSWIWSLTYFHGADKDKHKHENSSETLRLFC